jgi:penicillin-binding protein 1C
VRFAGYLILAITVLVAVAWYFLPAPPPLEGVTWSQRLLDRDGQVLRVTLTSDEKYRLYTPLGQVAPELVAATLLQEDQYFWKHPGLNPVALLRALGHACLGQTGRGGASTITMQLARLRYGLHTRTARGKLVQIWRALQIERHYPKARILEAYLNLAPYGRNIEGIGAASWWYLGKAPGALTQHEAVALSVLPQSPTRRAPRGPAANASLVSASRRLAGRFGHDLHRDEFEGGEFHVRSDREREFLAPHFVHRVLATHPAPRETVATTLDRELQRLIDKRLQAYVAANRRLGVANAAALLLDTHTMEVLAQVGSADFFDETISGQVDGTHSRRSPGSTLKPFIYAAALDQGLIHPETVLLDAPRRFAGYNPENFDGEFAGPIKATEALARSRNVPAVALAAELVHPTFYELLKRGGVALPHDESFYGLSLPLGGGEVTMEELVRLYATLANGGRWRPLRRIMERAVPSENSAAGLRLFSPEAAFLTLDMLGHVPRPDIGTLAGEDGIYWKTGTSMGFRDAWSVGVFDHFVLAVWVGNFDGHRNPVFVGRTCAGPLLFQIIDTLRAQGRAHPRPLPPPAGANLRRVDLCAVSGQLATDLCPHRITGWFIPGVSPIMPCEIHREIIVDTETGLRVPSDDGTRHLRREVFECWPSDILALFERAGLPRRRPPPFAPGFGVEALARTGRPPQITSPSNGQVYAIRADDPGNGVIALQARSESDVLKLYWFVGKTFLGAAPSREALTWHPTPGVYQILALDDRGRSSSCRVTIQSAGMN